MKRGKKKRNDNNMDQSFRLTSNDLIEWAWACLIDLTILIKFEKFLPAPPYVCDENDIYNLHWKMI